MTSTMNRFSRPIASLTAAIRHAHPPKATRAYTSGGENAKNSKKTQRSNGKVAMTQIRVDGQSDNKVKIKGHSLLHGQRPRRSFLYVPAHSQRFLEKALKSAADCIVLDLEDGVAPSQKAAARENIKHLLGRLAEEGYKTGENKGAELCIRVNHEGWLTQKRWACGPGGEIAAPSKELDQDLDLFAIPGTFKLPLTIVAPKITTPYDLRNLRTVIINKRKPLDTDFKFTNKITLIPTIETAAAVLNLPIFPAHVKYFSAMVFASEDYCASMGIPRTKDYSNMLFARSNLVHVCKAVGVSPIDMVCQDFKDLEVLKRECEEGVHLGFEGKQAIHPDQIETINKVFSPSAEQVEWAKALLEAVEKNTTNGAFEFEGKMVDRPVFRQAETIVTKHQLIEDFEKNRFVTEVAF
ncbi:hypothetical protein TWF730_008386 [Orbilia blumenaviensis]|uniref:HpcH/HpaI aldolase/citrate lyase domain-containing protein n=1 Tax=Orbilia blumenaviensis TaxID=1796055 RepID=A0AAV9V275_9PEZI